MAAVTATIADQNFLSLGVKSMTLGGERTGEGAKYVEWVPASPTDARFVTDGMIKHARGAGQVAILMEPYPLHPEDYHIAWERRHQFEAVLAHSTATAWGARWYPWGGSWIKPEHWGLHEKTKDISIIAGAKDSLPGHKLRRAIVETFGDRMDVYEGNYDKMQTMAPYRYSIIVENVRADGFWSEKLIDCVSVGTIPVYWGGDITNSGLMDFGMVKFETLTDMEGKLRWCTPEAYDGSFLFLERNLNVVRSLSHAAEDHILELYPELFQ